MVKSAPSSLSFKTSERVTSPFFPLPKIPSAAVIFLKRSSKRLFVELLEDLSKKTSKLSPAAWLAAHSFL
jgi:hypothetical protein